MRVLWEQSPRNANEVVQALQSLDPSWHPKTAKTLLGRLVRKEILDYEREGRAYLYYPRVSEEECVREVSDSFLRRVFDNSIGDLVVHFVRNKRLSRKEIAELRAILKEAEKR